MSGASQRTSYTGPAHSVTRRPGLLLDLAGEPLDQRLALVDHAAGRRPVVAAVAAPVLHEEHALVAQDERATDDPVTHAPILARWCDGASERREGRRGRPGAGSTSSSCGSSPRAPAPPRTPPAPSACEVGQIVKSLVFTPRRGTGDGARVRAATGSTRRRLAATLGGHRGRAGRRRRRARGHRLRHRRRPALRPPRAAARPPSTRTSSTTTWCGRPPARPRDVFAARARRARCASPAARSRRSASRSTPALLQRGGGPAARAWSAAFSSTRSARMRLGRMFSRRLGRLMLAQTCARRRRPAPRRRARRSGGRTTSRR